LRSKSTNTSIILLFAIQSNFRIQSILNKKTVYIVYCMKSNDKRMQDPFYVVKEEVDQSMQGITALYEQWRTLLNETNTYLNDEFKWTFDELKKGVKDIEVDLQELERTVAIVESNRSKFKIEETEIISRKGFIESIKQRVNVIKDDLYSPRTRGKIDKDQRDQLQQKKVVQTDKYAKLHNALEEDNDNFISSQQQKQQLIMGKLDNKYEVLHEAVGTLHQMGIQIDQTLDEQSKMITEIDEEVDKLDTGIKGAIQRVNKLIDSTKDSTQWCIIAFLAIILVVLLVLVFYIKK